jgi:NAD(P)-dependent dehydrogenase (short-subunit alcohol dehydrogenase family)
MPWFADQVILITGAGSGIGCELARALAAEGARIGAVDCNGAALEQIAVLLGKRAAYAVADVTDLSRLRRAVAGLEERLGPTDVFIANAGIARETPVETYRAEDFADQINVNLIGVSNSVAAVLPGMRERRRGHLVVLSSLASYRGLPLMAGYCASKAGVNALFDALRVELQSYNIAVTTLCPGFIRTPMTAPFRPPGRHLMELEDAVSHMVRAIRTRRPFLAFPSAPTSWMRLLRYSPRSWSDWLTAQYLRKLQRRAVERERARTVVHALKGQQ